MNDKNKKSIEELLAEAGDNYQQAYEEITNNKPQSSSSSSPS
jgi:hypothetical protein